MHRANGVELRAVAVIGCDADLIPQAQAVRDLVDEADRDAALEQERHVPNVAATRAREQLLMTCSGRPSAWLP